MTKPRHVYTPPDPPPGSDFNRWAASPAAFRNDILVDTDAGPRKFGDVCEPWQRADFEAMDAAWMRLVTGKGKPKVSRAYIERPRGHSKSSDVGIMLIWCLLFSPRKQNCVAAAGDQDQSLFLHDAIEAVVKCNPWLENWIDVQATCVVNTATKSILTFITSDAKSAYGSTPTVVVIDELTHWADKKGEQLYESLVSSVGKRDSCVLMVISNAGLNKGIGWQWQKREMARTDPRWHFSSLDGPKASWISQDRLDEMRRLLSPLTFSRVWLNIWHAGSGDIDQDLIDKAMRLEGPAIEQAEQGWAYCGGVDLGFRQDRTAIAVVGKHIGWLETKKPEPRRYGNTAVQAAVELGLMQSARPEEPEEIWHDGTGRVKLVYLGNWKPLPGKPVDAADIEAELIRLHDIWRFSAIAVDPNQADYFQSRLRKKQVPVFDMFPSVANNRDMALELLERLRDGTIDLFPDDYLVKDLQSLRVEERSTGTKLTSPRNADGHGDAATALQLALLAAKRFAGHRPYRVRGPLVLNNLDATP